MRISLLQISVVDGDPERNVARALAMLDSADPADLYLLPELWTTGYAHDVWEDAADRDTPRVLDRLRLEARDRGAWIGGSVITRRSDGALTNRFHLLSPAGDADATYEKMHLFAPMGETDRLAPGTGRVRAAIGPWTAGLSLCYDLRFPGMYRRDALDGANLFLVPSEWPRERRKVLELLARTRAAENQAYLALCNRTGPAVDGTVFAGESMLVGPDGDVICRVGSSETAVTGVARLESVEKARDGIPVLDDDRGTHRTL